MIGCIGLAETFSYAALGILNKVGFFNPNSLGIIKVALTRGIFVSTTSGSLKITVKNAESFIFLKSIFLRIANPFSHGEIAVGKKC